MTATGCLKGVQKYHDRRAVSLLDLSGFPRMAYRGCFHPWTAPMTLTGPLEKMQTRLIAPVAYALRIGDSTLPLNPLLGQTLELTHTGLIHCTACGRATKKSYSQGFCYPCSQKLACCDLCIVKPELCHYHAGTCREPDWGLSHCMQPHIVYLANSSGLKVGITRESQLPTRWIDQGATQALPILRVATRQQSGLIEVALARHVADRTDWRALLKGPPAPVDLAARRDELLQVCAPDIAALRERFGAAAITELAVEPVTLDYPVLSYPSKISSLDFAKTPTISGTLCGIKGQYLLFAHGVLNVRKFTAYQIAVAC